MSFYDSLGFDVSDFAATQLDTDDIENLLRIAEAVENTPEDVDVVIRSAGLEPSEEPQQKALQLILAASDRDSYDAALTTFEDEYDNFLAGIGAAIGGAASALGSKVFGNKDSADAAVGILGKLFGKEARAVRKYKRALRARAKGKNKRADRLFRKADELAQKAGYSDVEALIAAKEAAEAAGSDTAGAGRGQVAADMQEVDPTSDESRAQEEPLGEGELTEREKLVKGNKTLRIVSAGLIVGIIGAVAWAFMK